MQTGDSTTYAQDNHEFVADADPTTLAPCNGRIGSDGTYRYHATATFPPIFGCHANEVDVAVNDSDAGLGDRGCAQS
jgi:hypothetical protein